MTKRLATLLDAVPIVASTADRAALFPTPDTNQRVHNLQTAAIERWDGAQWVTDITSGALSVAQAAQLNVLSRWTETRTRLRGINDGDTMTSAELLTETHFGPFGSSAYTSATWVASSGTTDQVVFKKVDDRHCFILKPGVTMDAAGLRRLHFRPHSIAATVPARIEFREAFGNIVATPTLDTNIVPLPLSCSIQAWFRKETGGDSSHSRFTFGFCDFSLVYPSKTVARIGLIGDGAGGYRFGSVNCPDGVVAGDNAATDIDANSVQPTGLVAPGTNWFHARIKIVPPTPTQTGRWGAYLNGVLQATFATNVNFPRGSQGTNRNYAGIEPFFAYYPDTSQLPGILIDDLRVVFDEVYTL